MKRVLTFALACIFFALALTVPLCAVTPESTRTEAIKSEVTASVGVDTAGAAVLLIENRALAMMETFGYADAATERLITPTTVFEIGEISGLLVAVAAYRLAEENQLDLQADITRYLPESFVKRLSLAYPTTVEHLLLGCAGFEGRTFDLRFSKDAYRFDTLEKALLAQMPAQIAEPGSFYADSPFGIALAAYVIECVTGERYEVYGERAVLEPLGMEHTLLNPTKSSMPADAALGYTVNEEGQLAAASKGGRSYAGLYPANGAVSSIADLTQLLTFLLDEKESAVLSLSSRRALLQSRYGQGVFTLSAPAMQVRNAAMGTVSTTLHFGASLWLGADGSAALVLTNTAKSALLDLSPRLCGASLGTPYFEGGTLPDLESFEGHYLDAAGEDSSFVGRLMRRESNREARVDEDGTLHFLDLRLTQIAPGVFADADGDASLAVVQFVLNGEGEVEQVITAEGKSYMPAKFWQRKGPSTVLLAILVILSLWFIGGGLFCLLRYLINRYEEHHEGLVFLLPLLLAAMIGLCTFLQMLVGMKYGGSAFYSFFGAMSVLTLLLCVGAVTVFLLAFMASLTKRGMTSRVVRSACIFLLYVLIIRYWGLLLL